MLFKCWYVSVVTTHKSVSHVLALSHAWSKQDWTRSGWPGLKAERGVLYTWIWLCAFATLAYWILCFCFWGLSLLFYSFLWTWEFGFCSYGSQKSNRGQKYHFIFFLCLCTQLMGQPFQDGGLCLVQHVSVLIQHTNRANECQIQPHHVFNSAGLDCSIYKHLGSFKMSLYHILLCIYLSHLFVVLLLWVCQCQILCLFGHWSFKPWRLNVFIFWSSFMCQLLLSVALPYRTVILEGTEWFNSFFNKLYFTKVW